MAKIILAHDPSLTKEQLKKILTDRFADSGYEVGFSPLWGADLYIKKNNWVGVTIKLKQSSNETRLRVNGFVPSVMYRILVRGLLSLLILWPKWNKLIAEVRNFFEYDYTHFDVMNK